jgi:hypothetical protein
MSWTLLGTESTESPNQNERLFVSEWGRASISDEIKPSTWRKSKMPSGISNAKLSIYRGQKSPKGTIMSNSCTNRWPSILEVKAILQRHHSQGITPEPTLHIVSLWNRWEVGLTIGLAHEDPTHVTCFAYSMAPMPDVSAAVANVVLGRLSELTGTAVFAARNSVVGVMVFTYDQFMNLPEWYLDRLALTALPELVATGFILLEQVKGGGPVSEVLESFEAGLNSALERALLSCRSVAETQMGMGKQKQRSSPGGGQDNLN